ncbi:hypothetical protein Tco_0673862 [Tanacetum coccineum]
MRELREDTFSGNKNDDAHEHIERVLDIVSLFNMPEVLLVLLRDHEKARISPRSQSKRAGLKNQLMKAVRSSTHIVIVPSLSSSSQVFASLVSDRGNIIRRTASFSVSLYLNISHIPRDS